VLEKGILIVFEGIDGAGKSTQAEILMKTLLAKGLDVVYFREPTKSRWGRKIRKKALHPDSLTPEEELDLFLRDRKENVEKNLKPALEKKKIVVLDRYYYSTIAYQGAKGIEKKRIRQMNEEFVVKPDLVFIFDIDPQKGLKRIENRKKKDMLFEQEEYLVKVRKIFQDFKGENVVHIPAQRPINEISTKIEETVLRLLT
jgi:dTMP kinase